MIWKERPVWSKNALSAITSIPADRLKLILPVVAFYFTTGPWRNQWVKFGYDPRLEQSAASHQTLDYRVRLIMMTSFESTNVKLKKHLRFDPHLTLTQP